MNSQEMNSQRMTDVRRPTRVGGSGPRPRLVVAQSAAVAGTLFVVGVLVGGVARVSEAAAAPARIERIRYTADGGSARVVVILSRRVPHQVLVLAGEQARGSERRLVLDFSNARLGPGAVQPIGVEDGLLKQIRTGQFTARTARVVLDLASITGHKVWTQDDPPRVVVDIVGSPSPKGQTGDSAASRRSPGDAPSEHASTAEPMDGATPGTGVPGEAGEAAGSRALPGAESPTVATGEGQRPGEASGASPGDEEKETGASDAGRVARDSSAQPRGKRWRIVLDPGHGGSDPGARGVGGMLEKDVVLAIARKLKSRLVEGLHAEVLLTRNGDLTRSLAERTAFANANSADIFISIHANADPTGQLHGIETYTLNNTDDQATVRLAKMENGPALRTGRGDLSFILSDLLQSGKEEESITLAEHLQGAVLTRLRSRYPQVRDLGVKRGPFYVLVGAYMPCALIETSFLSHPVEGRRLEATEYQAAIAEGLYRGVGDFLGDARMAKTL